MAFGQHTGPPATSRQVDELLELLHAAGHDSFRDARGPMRFTQGFFILLGVSGFLEWTFMTTNYTLEGRDLIVRSGPFTWRIGIDDITSIEKPSGWVRSGSSPALSIDRLVASYGKGHRVMIAPAEKEKFLADLRARQKSSG